MLERIEIEEVLISDLEDLENLAKERLNDSDLDKRGRRSASAGDRRGATIGPCLLAASHGLNQPRCFAQTVTSPGAERASNSASAALNGCKSAPNPSS